MSYPITTVDPTEPKLPDDMEIDEECECEFESTYTEYWHDHDKECPTYKEGKAMEEGDRLQEQAKDNNL